MLNAFYSSLIHDNQVLILEALERLELDYQGGYREESIASIERIAAPSSQNREDDDDAVWIQIIRDLEDVGISHQIALTYRDFVVDWIIRAVNEGRLLEAREEPESPGSTRRSSGVNTNVCSLPTSLAAAYLNTKTEVTYVEDHSMLKQSPPTIACQKSDSSNALEPLHTLDPLTETLEERHLPVSSCNAPEPVYVSSPSSQAPEPVYGNDQDIAKELLRPANPTSEVAEPIPSAAVSDLNERAQRILAAWTKRDFVAAAELLEEQLAAVEQGFVTSNGLQPDRRVLRHCIGVCASFSGDLTKAKHFFESAFNGIYLIRNLDDGDIAAARWLGDVCLQLREFHNTVLAWSVALEGSVRRFGLSHDRTRHVTQEMLKLDEWVSAFRDINSQFHANVDPTDVFSNTHTLEKSDLVCAIQARVYEGKPRWSRNKSHCPTAALRPRPRLESIPGEDFLTGPIVSSGAWPLQWDSTFSPMAVYQMHWYLKIAKPMQPTLADRTLRTNSIGESKKLDFITKAGSTWLVETVKAIMRELEIEHAEHPDENVIVCCLNRDRDGLACSEGVLIGFWKLQFRNVCGMKISSVRWSTRKPPSAYSTRSLMDYGPPVDTAEFRDTVKEMLELAEARSISAAPIDEKASVQFSTRSWKPWGGSKRTSTSS